MIDSTTQPENLSIIQMMSDTTIVNATTTIVALTPVAILPFSRIVEHIPLTRRAVLGAVAAVLGVGLLTFSEHPPDAADVDHRDDGGSLKKPLDFPP